FSALLDELELPSRPTEMSFSVSCRSTGLEYSGHSLATLFAQRRNFFRPSFHRLLLEILRFNRYAKAWIQRGGSQATLGQVLAEGSFSEELARLYLLPMGAAIWSGTRAGILQFPAAFFLRFLDNHGLLDLADRPQWRTLIGGSRVYVDRLRKVLGESVHLSTPVQGIRRHEGGVEIALAEGRWRTFERVILATHADQALALLEDPTPEEREVLTALPFQDNEVILHTDTSLLPRCRRAWASWNYALGEDPEIPVTVTYNLNILQGLQAPETFCVSLNPEREIDPSRVLRRFRFSHPQYTLDGEEARAKKGLLDGRRRTYYCGAYWGAGFHEDGVVSALEVCRLLGAGE
ncbi:MAG: FAD-dependent oxidoreductase, partial [Acidobacteria bacterium]|nr:FAD-dependent oxidoreductase [Acidobacteriota bacterium]